VFNDAIIKCMADVKIEKRWKKKKKEREQIETETKESRENGLNILIWIQYQRIRLDIMNHSKQGGWLTLI
jgi:hypothetical protein